MEFGIVVLMLYIFFAIGVGFVLNTLIVNMVGMDSEFDEIISNTARRIVLIAIISMFWIITVPIILYNNLNGRN